MGSTPNLNLKLSAYIDSEHQEYNRNWTALDATHVPITGFAPFTYGGVQGHALGICAYRGTGTSYTENAIGFGKFVAARAFNTSQICGQITDGANAGSVGKFALYDANANLLTQTVFPVDTSKTGYFFSSWLSPLVSPAGDYILAWSACQETAPGTAKLEALNQDGLTNMANLMGVYFGTASNVMLGASGDYLFPEELGTLTANNNMSLMPLVFLS